MGTRGGVGGYSRSFSDSGPKLFSSPSVGVVHRVTGTGRRRRGWTRTVKVPRRDANGGHGNYGCLDPLPDTDLDEFKEVHRHEPLRAHLVPVPPVEQREPGVERLPALLETGTLVPVLSLQEEDEGLHHEPL